MIEDLAKEVIGSGDPGSENEKNHPGDSSVRIDEPSHRLIKLSDATDLGMYHSVAVKKLSKNTSTDAGSEFSVPVSVSLNQPVPSVKIEELPGEMLGEIGSHMLGTERDCLRSSCKLFSTLLRPSGKWKVELLFHYLNRDLAMFKNYRWQRSHTQFSIYSLAFRDGLGKFSERIEDNYIWGNVVVKTMRCTWLPDIKSLPAIIPEKLIASITIWVNKKKMFSFCTYDMISFTKYNRLLPYYTLTYYTVGQDTALDTALVIHDKFRKHLRPLSPEIAEEEDRLIQEKIRKIEREKDKLEQERQRNCVIS